MPANATQKRLIQTIGIMFIQVNKLEYSVLAGPMLRPLKL